jgi:triosephosphate isomerase
MRTKLVAGNWKMNGSLESIRALIEGLQGGMESIKQAGVAVCPPAIYIPEVAQLLKGSRIVLGSQNICEQDSGAYTGEIAGPMLKEFNCEFAIVGHSERRSLYHETDEMVAQRFAAARRHGLKPILCVGELLEEREQGITEEVVDRQIDAVIKLEGIEAFADAVIAYEPVWAIGTGKTASPQQAQDVHQFIRGKLAALDATIAENIVIQYGGSVNAGNASELFAMEDIDGGLIGGASLKPDDFLAICQAAD